MSLNNTTRYNTIHISSGVAALTTVWHIMQSLTKVLLVISDRQQLPNAHTDMPRPAQYSTYFSAAALDPRTFDLLSSTSNAVAESSCLVADSSCVCSLRYVYTLCMSRRCCLYKRRSTSCSQTSHFVVSSCKHHRLVV